jgi:hypothetical protein
MPKVYVYDDETPTYYVKTDKPEGLSTDEIELTDEELQSILWAEEAMLDAQELLRTRLLDTYVQARILEIRPLVQEALKRVAPQVGIPYKLGSATGGATKLHEYCTFTVTGLEPVVFGVTIFMVDGLFNLTIDVTGEDSGTIHWKAAKVKVAGAIILQTVKDALLKFPEPNVIRSCLNQPMLTSP